MATKKRSHGDGYITRRRSGLWVGQLMDGYYDDGRRRIVTFKGESKSAVSDMIRDYKNERDRGVKIDKTLTFSEWASIWYVDYRSEVQPSTYSGYKYTLNILKEHFGTTVLADILPIHINSFLDSLLDKGVSLSLLRKCKAMLIQIFDSAEVNGLILRNPARYAKKNKNKMMAASAQQSQKDAFSEDEVNTLLSELQDTLLGNSTRVLLGTGMRVQELLALRKSDVAEDYSIISINKAIKMVDGQPTLGTPKSKRGQREIPVPEEYRPYVKRMLELGGVDHIWVRSGKTPYYDIGTFRKQYYKELNRIPDIRKLPPHCCRHTYVTRLQGRGVPMETIAALVGHSSIDVTDGYLHIKANTLADAVSKLNSATK